MPNGGKQYVNEKVQQYQQWAAEHPEANEYVKFAAYSGSAYAGYKGAAAMDAAWAARKASKENAKAVSGGPAIWPEQMNRLSELNLELSFSFYPADW